MSAAAWRFPCRIPRARKWTRKSCTTCKWETRLLLAACGAKPGGIRMALEYLVPVEGGAAPDEAALLFARYQAVRRCTEQVCEPLATEDYVVQSMPDASPVKWHLAHTSWFFETFVLAPHLPGYEPFHPLFGVLFNSYYH